MRGSKIFIPFLFWAIMAGPLLAQVTVTIPDTTAYPGDTLFIPVDVSDLTGKEVYSYECRLKFNPMVVQFIRVDSTRTLTETWSKTWLNTELPGEIRLGNYGVNALNNAGVLIYLGFKIVGTINDSSRFELQDFEFNAGQPTAEVANGSVKIKHPPVTVRFRSNVSAPLVIFFDNLEKKLPFDTTLTHGSSHTISTKSPQYLAPDTRVTFQQWSDGGGMSHTIVPVSDTTFTLVMDEEFLLTLQSSYGTPTGAGWYIRGKNATFSVDSLAQQTDSTRYVFVRWSGSGSSSYSGPQRTVTIVMNSPVVETAQWGVQYFLAIRSTHGTPIGQGWHNKGDTVTIAIDSLVVPITGTRYIFQSWTGNGTGSYTGAKRVATVTMSSPIRQLANWRTEHYLMVKSSPAGIVQFKQSGWYAKNSQVSTDTAPNSVASISAIYRFHQWMKDQIAQIGNPIQITMDTSHVAEAHYQIDSVSVTITTNIGPGSSIIVDGSRQSAPFSSWWQYQSRHVVAIDSVQTAAHQNTRYLFESWSDQGAREHTVIADTNFQLTATLAIQHLLHLDTHPPGLLQFAEAGWYRQGSSVTIPSVPAQIRVGQEQLDFKGWYLDKNFIGQELHQIQMERPHSLIAAYMDLLSIKGKINDRRGQVVPNIKVVLSGAVNDTVLSSDQGAYAFEMLTVGDYMVTPESDGFRFEPAMRTFLALSESRADQNFVAIDTLKPQVCLIYPNGGERLIAASIDTIKWQATDNMAIDSIAIDFSSDQGQSWIPVVSIHGDTVSSYLWTLPSLSSDRCQLRIIVKDLDGNLAVDLSDGTFTVTEKAAIHDEAGPQVPGSFALEQNYPNPFNSSTLIRFELPVAINVRIKIFNTMGQHIATVVDRNFEAGYHQITWDGRDQVGRDLSSGIYFYQVEAGELMMMRRMLLLR